MRTGLLLNDSELETIRKKIDAHEWAASAYRRLKNQAEEIFFLKGRLTHSALEAVEAAALVFAISGNGEYADRAGERIHNCATFAELFGAVTSATYNFGCNTLLTGHQLPHLCIATDLLWDALPDPTRTHIEERLIRPAVLHLRSNDRRDSNWQTMHSSGILAAGLLLGERGFSDFALDDPDHGLRRHLTTAFRSDGLHWEGSFGYHRYALSQLLLCAEMARHAGIDLYAEGGDDPYLHRMLDAFLRLAFPDGSLPVNNDAGPMDLPDVAPEFELGYARYRDPAFGWVLAQSDRTSRNALLFGEPELQVRPPQSRSVTLEQSGWTVLKSPEGAAYWKADAAAVLLDHGPHGDWHGHPDKLGIEFFAGGLPWIRNEGSPTGYHGQQHWEYFRRTLAHNTVVVDGKDQAFQRVADDAVKDLERTGTVHDLALEGQRKTVSASVDWAYDGVSYRRTLTLEGSVLTDEFELASDRVHTFDYVLHGRGTTDLSELQPEPARFPETEGGYEYFVRTVRAKPDGAWTARFQDGGWPDGRFVPTGKQLEIRVEGEPDTEVYAGYGPSHLRGVNLPFILVRRHARTTTFRATLRPLSAEPG